jgi:hypothetical protein
MMLGSYDIVMFPILHHAVGTLGSSGSSRVVLHNRSRMITRAVVVVVRVSRGGGQCSNGGEASGAFSERAN